MSQESHFQPQDGPTERLDSSSSASFPSGMPQGELSPTQLAPTLRFNAGHSGLNPLGVFSQPYSGQPSQTVASEANAHYIREEFSWFDRDILQGMVWYGPDTDNFVVILTPQAIKDLKEGTERYKPNEAFGNLMGKTYRDNRGIFTVIAGAVYARKLNASPAHVQLSNEEMRTLRFEAERTYPTASFVGWTHSHNSFSEYSRIDLKEQRTWSYYNIGILTFMTYALDDPWCVLYRGPQSQMLVSHETETLIKGIGQQSISSTNDQLDDEDIRDTRDANISEGSHNAPGALKTPSRFKRLFSRLFSTLAIGGLLAAILFFGFMLLQIQNNVTALRSQVSNAHQVTTNYSVIEQGTQWNCAIQGQFAPVKMQCTGPQTADITGWIWDFGDGTVLKSSSATHTYHDPGVYTITLTLISNSGNQSVSTVKVTIKALPVQVTATAKT